jgi:hypothetical protein
MEQEYVRIRSLRSVHRSVSCLDGRLAWPNARAAVKFKSRRPVQGQQEAIWRRSSGHAPTAAPGMSGLD